MNKQAYGGLGEALALQYLKKKKYKILKTNYKTKLGEIDIIAKLKDTTVFLEVKARESLAFGQPSEAVTVHKQNKIRQVAVQYLLSQNNYPSSMRFDVVEVLEQQVINHIEGAF